MTCRTWQLRVASWDLMTWLPCADGDDSRPHALVSRTAEDCWQATWDGQPLFAELIKEIMETKVDIIMSEPQPVRQVVAVIIVRSAVCQVIAVIITLF